jgi:hypothetical protein
MDMRRNHLHQPNILISLHNVNHLHLHHLVVLLYHNHVINHLHHHLLVMYNVVVHLHLVQKILLLV